MNYGIRELTIEELGSVSGGSAWFNAGGGVVNSVLGGLNSAHGGSNIASSLTCTNVPYTIVIAAGAHLIDHSRPSMLCE